jgi:hypothetical protein
MFKFLATVSAVVLTTVPALASVVINIEEVGADLVASYSGTVDVSGLVSDGGGTLNVGFSPSGEIAFIGGEADFYNLETSFANFGTVSNVLPNSKTGDFFGISSSLSGAPGTVVVASGFTSGNLSGSMTFDGFDFDDLGLIAGTSFVATSLNDTFTLNIVGDPVNAVPLPATLPLLFAGIGALGIARRKRG